ncbi:MAG: bifunctional 2-polyprenyl-6-hydroxyphenol methylase/3-demethylubiquinol 3-O-methyltransferase UbiG [Rhodobacteraceae bacterium]|nr:bifunctional 2-polyprenyl-6-hydroxyphenol methylase/3-demethylubiquinol 3-O-methyltransferase UbiG [Paracoccaceae bacterium]
MHSDPSETAKFNALADQWWDPHGPFRPLHMLNPARLDYINSVTEIEFDRNLDESRPFSGLSVLDVGCGGGLLCEPLARLGADVTGIDPAENNIPAASAHAGTAGLEITYRCSTAEEMAAQDQQFDVVLAMEVIEHVPDQAAFIATCARLVKPSGLFFCSTINRTVKSFALAIVGAEYLLRWLPVGTHEWRRFVKPDEIFAMHESADLEIIDCKGFIFNPLTSEWKISGSDTDVNYASVARKPASARHR